MQNELFEPSSAPNRLLGLQIADWPVAKGWESVVAAFFASEVGAHLVEKLQTMLSSGACIYPAAPFKALELTPLDQVRVVILGQDPYHGAGQAEGLAFSVATGVKIPPSLRNILKEIARTEAAQVVGVTASGQNNGSLLRWAKQGVLLLNTCLTVEDAQPASHAKLGWEALSDALISLVAERNKNVVFMLWGAHAQSKQALLQVPKSLENAHLVLCANHPSPLSALRPPKPFLGCGHFEQANIFLKKCGLESIEW